MCSDVSTTLTTRLILRVFETFLEVGKTLDAQRYFLIRFMIKRGKLSEVNITSDYNA